MSLFYNEKEKEMIQSRGLNLSKPSSIKLKILEIALFVAFFGIGWVIGEILNIQQFMDVFADAISK